MRDDCDDDEFENGFCCNKGEHVVLGNDSKDTENCDNHVYNEISKYSFVGMLVISFASKNIVY